MITFSPKQEAAILRRDCRTWTELIADVWYNSGKPGALDYPAEVLTQQMRAVYFQCHAAGIENIEYVSRLGLNVLRATSLGCDGEDIIAMSRYFVHYAKGDNVDYAQNWVDYYLEGH